MNLSTASTDRALVELRRICVTINRQQILREITLSIPRGQTLAVIGESGCGKTVMLKTIIGMIRPAHGEVIFDGKNMVSLDERELTRQRTRFGFVFQGAALFDSMTVAENVSFPLRQHTQKPPREQREMVLSRLAEVGLSADVMKKKPAELSGGMRKRVGLARALIMNPELILYDEPTTGLDPIMSDVINELIMRTREKYPVTGVVVTHDLRTAKKVADRIVMLYPLHRLNQENQILYDGPPREIESSPDRRVTQFVRGEAGDRLNEIRDMNGAAMETVDY